MSKTIKSGKEILDDFFNNIQSIDNVDKNIASVFATLYEQGKLSDIQIKNELQNLRDKNAKGKN